MEEFGATLISFQVRGVYSRESNMVKLVNCSDFFFLRFLFLDVNFVRSMTFNESNNLDNI